MYRGSYIRSERKGGWGGGGATWFQVGSKQLFVQVRESLLVFARVENNRGA